MKHSELREKVLQGGQKAIQKLLEKKRKDNSYVVVAKNGKVLQIPAKDIK